jgi:hypothetical protein
MSKVGDLYLELEDYVREALDSFGGYSTIDDIMVYLQKNHSDFPLKYDENVIDQILDVINSDENLNTL